MIDVTEMTRLESKIDNLVIQANVVGSGLSDIKQDLRDLRKEVRGNLALARYRHARHRDGAGNHHG